MTETERDAARYRWIHDNIDFVDGDFVIRLHPDAGMCCMFQWGIDNAMRVTDQQPVSHNGDNG